ncbi:MAG: hypothetical protein MJE63_12275, partial [Proteobacteria bacterium]|nr:hypothetical protein [Pseudomonadota bacterium]
LPINHQGKTGSVFRGKTWFDSTKDSVFKKARSLDKHLHTSRQRKRTLVEYWRKASLGRVVRKMEARGNRDAQKILDTTLGLLER